MHQSSRDRLGRDKKEYLILKKLEFSDIEMLRMWRNSDNVKKYMEFKGYITIEMQKNGTCETGEFYKKFIESIFHVTESQI